MVAKPMKILGVTFSIVYRVSLKLALSPATYLLRRLVQAVHLLWLQQSFSRCLVTPYATLWQDDCVLLTRLTSSNIIIGYHAE